MVSFEEGDGSYFAALAGHALRLGRHGFVSSSDAGYAQVLVSDRRRVDRRPPPPGIVMSNYCCSLGGCDAPVDNASPSS
jgi:hypothetical protein